MALEQYVALANITLSSATPEVSFSNIPQNYKDLMLIVYGRSSYTVNADDGVSIRINGDTGSNYPGVLALGYSGGTYTTTSTTTRLQAGPIPSSSSSNTSPGEVILNIMDYSATDKNKTTLSRGNSMPNTSTGMWAGRWANTAAITSIAIYSDRYLQGASSELVAGSTFTLYGVR